MTVVRGRIDDPIDASYGAWPGEEENLASDLALAALAPFSEAAHLLNLVKEVFSGRGRVNRILYLLEGFRLKIGELGLELEALKSRVESPEFKEALITSMNEASQTLDKKKVDRYSSILAGSLRPNEPVDASIDLSTLIRDTSMLGEQDIRVLGILVSLYADVLAQQPNVHDPNAFTERIGEFRHAVVDSGLQTDDFRSICERLAGFGLAAEVLRNPSRMGLGDFCYRPTRRGLKLLNLIGRSK